MFKSRQKITEERRTSSNMTHPTRQRPPLATRMAESARPPADAGCSQEQLRVWRAAEAELGAAKVFPTNHTSERNSGATAIGGSIGDVYRGG